jgi:CRP-like cAMP-binding protein
VSERAIHDLLAAHPFFSGLAERDVEFLAGCGRNVHVGAGSHVFHEGEAADRFFVVRAGRVALEALAPGRGPLVIDTVGAGEVLGVSWLIPPYRWTFDARVVESLHAVAMDGVCIRRKCEDDPRLGFDLLQRLAGVLQGRLQSARVRLLDLYGAPRAG